MSSLIAHPQNEAQEKAVRAVLDALAVPYEETTENELKEDATGWLQHSAKNKSHLDESIRQLEEGKSKSIPMDDLWK